MKKLTCPAVSSRSTDSGQVVIQGGGLAQLVASLIASMKLNNTRPC